MLDQRGNDSLIQSLKHLTEAEREKWLKSLKDDEAEALLWDWKFWARENQLTPPGDWYYWLLLAGRGFGKTRTGVEWVKEQVGPADKQNGIILGLVASTAADARDVMVEGESGILQKSPPWNMPKYEPSKRRLTWPNGAMATTFSAEEPDQLRGPQFHGGWADELGKWKYAEDAWDNFQFGLRLGNEPKVVITTTPRPTKLIKQLIKDSKTFITRGSTYINAGNLAPAFLKKIIAKYEGTRLGRQELHAALLEDTPGALWTLVRIELLRVLIILTGADCSRG
jgi:phage terminase large subunit-like protein